MPDNARASKVDFLLLFFRFLRTDGTWIGLDEPERDTRAEGEEEGEES